MKAAAMPSRLPIMETQPVTLLLRRASAGDSEAAELLYSTVYDELRRRARNLMGSDALSSTLQPTAVVNEAWMKLCPSVELQEGVEWKEREHFLAVASKAMRSVLVDHARARATDRRGGNGYRVEWEEAVALFDERSVNLVHLDDALQELAKLDPQLAKLVELRFFGGLTIEETAGILGTSTASLNRAWRTARAWLRAELDVDGPRHEEPTDS